MHVVRYTTDQFLFDNTGSYQLDYQNQRKPNFE